MKKHLLEGGFQGQKFVDSHVEHWRWVVPKDFYYWIQAVPPEEMPDYMRVQNAMKQLTDN